MSKRIVFNIPAGVARADELIDLWQHKFEVVAEDRAPRVAWDPSAHPEIRILATWPLGRAHSCGPLRWYEQ